MGTRFKDRILRMLADWTVDVGSHPTAIELPTSAYLNTAVDFGVRDPDAEIRPVWRSPVYYYTGEGNGPSATPPLTVQVGDSFSICGPRGQVTIRDAEAIMRAKGGA